MRADYLGRLIAYAPLKAALDAGPFTVGPMSEAELRLAVTGPAAEAGLVVEPAVVEAVIAELRDEAGGGLGSGVLPLMSQAMAATWQCREGSELTLRGYRRAGGVADAVDRARPGRLRRPDQRPAGCGPPGVYPADRHHGRWPVRAAPVPAGRPESPAAPMAADIDAVIDVFSARRLLVLGADSVEIAHDALLQAWKQLRDWLGDDQLDRALYSQVVTDAATWDSNGRDAGLPVPAGAAGHHRRRRRPLAGRSRPLPPAACHQRGVPGRRASRRAPRHPAAAQRDRRPAGPDRDRHQRRRDRRPRRRDASRQAASASRQHAIALSRQLATESLAVGSADPLTARRLAVAAWRIFPTDQAGSVLASLLTEQQQDGILPGNPADAAERGGVQPGQQAAGRAYGDGYVRLWNPATGQAVGAPLPADTGRRGGAFGVAFSPDGKLLATAERPRHRTAVEPGHRAGRRRSPPG